MHTNIKRRVSKSSFYCLGPLGSTFGKLSGEVFIL